MNKDNKSDNFVVTARKWRPLQFKDIVGQSHITKTLQNAIGLKKIHHAYIFSGLRGVGKTTTARILARAVNCLNPQGAEPCNECENCRAVIDGRSMDIIEIDGASNNSVDDIRKLRENAKYPPVNGKYKMYIIDEVHMLSTSAFNALLKTLEEPPPHLLFVFATTESHKIPATILSRCQRHEFRRMEIEDTVKQLKFIAEQEEIDIDEDSLLTIAKKADGSMRDSQSIFDQVVAFCGKTIRYIDMADALHLIDQDFYFRITKAVREKNLAEMFEITRQVLAKGYDFQETFSGLLEHLRNILTVQVTDNTRLIESSESYLKLFRDEAAHFSRQDLLRLMNLVSSAEQALKYSPQPRVRFELTLITMASMDTAIEIKELIEEVRALKNISPEAVQISSATTALEKKTENVPISAPKEAARQKEDYPPITAQKAVVKDPAVEHDKAKQKNVIVDKTPEKKSEHRETIVKADGLKQLWPKFLAKYANAQNGLHMLNQTAMIRPEFFEGEIFFAASNEFSAEGLKKSQQKLMDFLKEFYNANIRIKISVGDVENIPEPPEPKKVINTEDRDINRVTEHSQNSQEAPATTDENKEMDINSSKQEPGEKVDLTEKHPVEQEIVNLFGAEEIRNSNR